MASGRRRRPKSKGASAHLRALFPGTSPSDLFREKARALRLDAGIAGPPFDPFAYAAALAIPVREVAGGVVDGCLMFVDGGFVIELRRDVPTERKRFTLAHEIAHSFFYDVLSRHRKDKTAVDPDEERLCNQAAAELLMPADLFGRDAKAISDPVTPAAVVELSRAYRVSLRAAATRVSDLQKGTSCALWRKSRASIDLQWIAPGWDGPLMLCQTGYSSVEEAFEMRGKEITKLDRFYPRGVQNYITRRTASLAVSVDQALSILNRSLQPRSPSLG